ncbi:hypothetical protein [Streptomyces cacaoi]|uniref:hypothetical protein n=1 Tax=Streptomyces cacaoi TaxID=1898 RepID=UPI00374A589F
MGQNDEPEETREPRGPARHEAADGSEETGTGGGNTFSGEALTVVQAGSITGDVTVHVAPGPRSADGRPVPPGDEEPGSPGEPREPERTGEPLALTCEVRAHEYVLPTGWSDAVPVSGGAVRVYAEARADRAVLLRTLRPVVLARRPPVQGTLCASAGTLEVRSYTLELGGRQPRLRGPEFLYTVTPGDPEVFDLTVRCERHAVEWRLELDWTCAGRTGTAVVDLGGHPFRFTGRPGRRGWWPRAARR